MQRDLLRDLPLEDFTENLDGEEVLASRDTPASTSRESDSEPPRKVVPKKHSIFTHFPKDRNGEVCKRTQITRASGRKRTGDAAPQAENIGDLTTADHKVLSERCESRNNYRYAVAVQDLATQWIQCFRRWKGVHESFSRRQKSQKSFVQTTLWNLTKIVKNYHGIIVHQHLTDLR